MLLEEALLYLLRVSGYRTIEDVREDPETLQRGPAGLQVLGRGGRHQADAIADFVIAPPFSYPQRLLLEAKCYSEQYRVGLDKVRNAVGVLKDVQEFWVSRGDAPPKQRYHYQYAMFSASGYSSDAQQYAYAHDIYLIPLQNSPFMQPIIRSIRNVSARSFGVEHGNQSIAINLSELRSTVRRRIRGLADQDIMYEGFAEFYSSCNQLNGALLAMIARRFPVFLVPAPGLNINELRPVYDVSIHWDRDGWYLHSMTRDGERLFSFDLPPDLFEMYAENGVLSPESALELKEEALAEIQGIVTPGADRLNYERPTAQVVTFRLDYDWLTRVRNRLHALRQ